MTQVEVRSSSSSRVDCRVEPENASDQGNILYILSGNERTMEV